MTENVTQIKRRIKINVEGNGKIRENIICAKETTFKILVHVLV